MKHVTGGQESEKPPDGESGAQDAPGAPADPPRSLFGMYVRSTMANVALPLSAVLTGPLIARSLGPEGRGAMAALLAPISLANLMFTLGAPESLTFHVAKRLMSKESAKRFALWAGISCGAMAIGACVLATPYLLRKYPDLHLAFYLLLATLPLTTGFAALRGIAQGLRQFDVINAERATSVLVRVVAIVVVVVAGLTTPSLLAAITILSGLAGSLLLLRFFRRTSFTASSEVSRSAVRGYAITSAFGTLGAFAVLRLDQTMMAPLSEPAQLGYYAVAVSLAELPITIVFAVRDIVFTVASDTDDPTIAARAARLTTMLMIPVCGIGCLVAPVGIPLLFGESFAPSVAMTQILLAATVLSTTSAIVGAGLMSLGRAGWRSALQIAGAVLTLALLLLLVPSMGGIGAALASLITYAILSVGSVLLFSRASRITVRRCLVPTRQDVDELRGAARALSARLRRARR